MSKNQKMLIDLIRKSADEELEFNVNGYSCPCRILSARQEIDAISRAKRTSNKVPDIGTKDLVEKMEIQKEILFSATTIGTEHYLPKEVLDQMDSDTLASSYDAYRSMIKLRSPQFEALSNAEIMDLISQVKKKQMTTNDCYIYQLVAIGKYFLDGIQQTDRERGL